MIPDFDSIFHLVKDPIRQTVTRPQPHESASFLSSFGKIPVYTHPKMEAIRFLSDARRVEAAIIPSMCFEVIHNWHSTTPFDTERLKHDFTTAIEQMILGRTMATAAKLSRRAIGEAQKLFHGRLGGYFTEGTTYEKIAVVLYALACDLTADGTFELVEGSVMHRALDDMRDAALKKLHPKQVRSAEDQAVKFRRFLSERGYFR